MVIYHSKNSLLLFSPSPKADFNLNIPPPLSPTFLSARRQKKILIEDSNIKSEAKRTEENTC